jgi:diguanylate cyclase (GGDEF)-like protein
MVGRAAKRGRTIRVDTDAESQMLSGQHVDGMQSGIVIPLIVGARVVGTLSCWSRRAYAFDQEDERVLEMMASQVATAVAAADLTEMSERRALHDALTGLPNRRQLGIDVAGPLQEVALAGRPAVVAMADIDHFKRFNDDFGHRVGDVTLQKVASVLEASVRQGDRVYRYGGEEFLLIFEGVSAAEGLALAERVRTAVETTPFSGDTLEPVGPVTISIGLAAMPDDASDFETLVGLADTAMYRSKALGRNKVTLWTAEDAPAVSTAA